MLIMQLHSLNVYMKGFQKRVTQYRGGKAKKAELESFISEKRKNIERLMQEQAPIEPEEELNLEKFANDIDLKHKKYLEDISALEDVKLAIIEARGTLDGLQLEVAHQEQTLATLQKTFKRQVTSQEEMVDQLRGRLGGERAERTRMEEERCQRNLQHVQKLTNEKEELINRTEEMLRKRKGLDLALKKLKDNFEEDYKRQREVWAQAEQERREKWEQLKLEEINENTLKGLEPEINRIVATSRLEIAKIEEKYEKLRNDYTRQMNEQFEANIRQIRKEISERADIEKATTAERISEQHRKQLQRLISSFQTQKSQLRCAKQAELRELDARRKRQTEEFMARNKDYLLTHLTEVKQIKANYENEIRQLDGSLDKMLSKEEAAIQQRYSNRIQAHREEKRKELQAKVKAFHYQQKQQSESLYEDIVEKVAVQNQVIETDLRRKTEAKIKEYKENQESELKTIRKSLQALMGKEKQETQALRDVKEVKEGIQAQYDDLLREQEYLKKKQAQYQAEVVRLKSKESQLIDIQGKDMTRVQQQWQEQISLLEKKINQVQQEMEAHERIMQEKQDEERNNIAAMMSKLEKESLQVIRKVNQEIERARKEKAMKVSLNGKLIEMRKKLKDMEAKRKQ